MGLNGYVINLRLWNRFTQSQQELLERAFERHVDAIWAFAMELHDDASSCNTGGSCVLGERHQLIEVKPTAKDYELLRDAVAQTTFKDWATRCEKTYPGCAEDWEARVGPVLQRAGDRLWFRQP